jgi:hypothetical protein
MERLPVGDRHLYVCTAECILTRFCSGVGLAVPDKTPVALAAGCVGGRNS